MDDESNESLMDSPNFDLYYAREELPFEETLVLYDEAITKTSAASDIPADARYARLAYIAYLKGDTYECLGDLRLAVRWFIKAIKWNSRRSRFDNSLFWLALGNIFVEMNKIRWAKTCFERITDPTMRTMRNFHPELDGPVGGE